MAMIETPEQKRDRLKAGIKEVYTALAHYMKHKRDTERLGQPDLKKESHKSPEDPSVREMVWFIEDAIRNMEDEINEVEELIAREGT